MQPVHERGRALLDPLRGRRAELGAGGELDRGAGRRRHPQRRDRGAEIEGPRGDARRTGSELALELVQEAVFRGTRGGASGWRDRRGGRGRVVGADGRRERSPGGTGNCHGVASLSATPPSPARGREAGAAPAKRPPFLTDLFPRRIRVRQTPRVQKSRGNNLLPRLSPVVRMTVY